MRPAVHRRRSALTVLAAGAILLLAGCADSLGDRGGQDGAPPDEVLDVDYVEVYRNADGFPNVSRVCVQGLGFATSSTGGGESGGGPAIVRVSEWDDFCATKQG